MEHRWGVRISVDIGVQLICQPGSIGTGRLTDISISGAYVRTRLDLATLATVRLVVVPATRTSARAFDRVAYVARKDTTGLALEWWDLAPIVLHGERH